jgi:DNA polymerase (family 10)
MNRTLAKLTGFFMGVFQHPRVMPEPGANPPFGASLKNEDFARVLEEIADLLELADGNAFRVLAYRNAARELRGTGYDVAALLAAGEPLPKMPGIGADLEAKLREIFATGTSATLQKLRNAYPPGIGELLRLPGVGPKRVRLFHERLGVGSLADLEQAIRTGRLRALGGFGAKSEQRILTAIETVKSSNARRS